MTNNNTRPVSNSSNSDESRPASLEDAVGNAFLHLLRETGGLTEGEGISANHHAVQAFVKEVLRRKAQPLGAYDSFIDLAASSAVRLLVYGVDCEDESRKDPASLVLYRKMRWLVNHPSATLDGPASGLDGPESEEDREFEAIERQALLNEAYDSGYSAGFDAGAKAEAASSSIPRQPHLCYADGFEAGRRAEWARSERSDAYVAGQRVERERVRSLLEEHEKRTGRTVVVPGLFPLPESIGTYEQPEGPSHQPLKYSALEDPTLE